MTYEYTCSVSPEHKYVEVRSINAEVSRTTCAAEGCDGKLLRVFSAPPITFKGSGFSSTKG